MKKVALVTGAGSGIGRSAALALHNDGFQLVLLGRRRDQLEETASLASNRARPLVIPADVSDADSVASGFYQIQKEFGRLDLLFNNAGVGAPRVPIEDLSVEDWRRTVDINLTGSFLCAREAFRLMKVQNPQGGRIINNGSISAHSPRPDTVAYTSTKHAITGLTKSLSLDGRKYNIACSQIDIGNADTAIGERFKRGVPQANGTIQVEPVIDVEHCGRTVCFMASLPLNANIQFITIMATNMPFVGRG